MEQRRSHGDRGAWTRFQPRLSLLLLIYGTLASCKCGGTSRIIIKDEDVNCDDISLICTCTKGGGKCGKRWLRAAKRTAVAKEVSTQSVHVYRANKAQEMMQEDECEPPNFYSSPVLRVAKHEFLSKQFLDHDPVKAVQLQKRTTGANIIHNIGLDPFYVHYWTNYQVDIYRRYASKNKTSLCFDATGSIVKKIFKPEHGHAGPVFLYQGVMNTEEGQFSVSHMLSESHNTNSIQFWLNEWMRSGAPRPDEVVVDSSKALINAIIRAFTSYNTITEYANACWGSNVPQCYVRIDVAHFIKIYVDFLKTPPERIKIFYRAAIGQLIISRSLRDAEKVFEAILLVSLSETEGLLPDGTKCDSENAKIFIKKLITEENTEINETDNESDSNLREFNVRIANEDAVQEEIIEVMSEWKNWGTNIQKRVTLATESQIGDRENAHYFPALAKKLMNDVAHLPLWSCVVRDKFGYGRIPASSAPVEGEFNKIKTHLLKNETLPIRVDRFLDQHINYMSGRTKLLGAKLIDKEDLAIDNHQSGDNSIATTINENGIVSVADSQELLKSDAIKIGNKSGKEIEENARVQDEAADTLPTQVQCPACQNNDKPTGAHQCIICQTSVHALELCSIALPDSEEGYGQQRICLTCHSTQSVPLILATRNEENWRGLNLQNKNKKRKASKYLGDEKHKIKEKLTFEKNKKLPIIKNGSHESLHALTVNGKKVYVTYTCAFDSVYQVMLAAFCDRPDLRKMVEERDTQTDLIAMVFDVLDKGLRASSYQNRAKIMCSLFTLEPGAYDSFIVNCSTGVPALARKLFQNVPSFTELVVCDNGCDPETSIRAVPIIDEVTLRVDKLDISEVLKLPRVCNVPECTGSVSANISASGTIVIFEVSSDTSNVKIKLQDLPKEFTSPSASHRIYNLVGVINEKIPRTRDTIDKFGLSHYTACCLRSGGTWEEYDDNKKSEIKRRERTEVHAALLIYVESSAK